MKLVDLLKTLSEKTIITLLDENNNELYKGSKNDIVMIKQSSKLVENVVPTGIHTMRVYIIK